MKWNEIILFTIFALVAIFILFSVFQPARAPGSDGPQACTLEAKICPDGSAVGRTGPNCEFAACPVATTTAATTTTGVPPPSGVEGTVLLGPTCPVVQDPPDPECADRPYATAIFVYRTGGATPVLIGNSDPQGRFRFHLPPGSYTLIAKGGLPAQAGTTLPYCSETSVAVVPGEYTTTLISCDTGIR